MQIDHCKQFKADVCTINFQSEKESYNVISFTSRLYFNYRLSNQA